MCRNEILNTNSVCLHEPKEERHFLCLGCVRKYVEQLTAGRAYEYQSSRGELKKYPCPFMGCDKHFSAEVAGKGFKEAENIKLLKNARNRFGKQDGVE